MGDMSFAFTLRPEEAAKLLYDLEHDVTFRQAVTDDPVAALRPYGVVVARDQLPDEISLPSPQVIAALRDEYTDAGAIADGTEFWFPFLTLGIIIQWHPFIRGEADTTT